MLLLGAGGLKETGPVIRIVKLGSEHGAKVSVLEIFWIIVAHELNHVGFIRALPVPFNNIFELTDQSSFREETID